MRPGQKSKRIRDTSKTCPRIVDTGPCDRSIDPDEFAKALGAEPCSPEEELRIRMSWRSPPIADPIQEFKK